MLRLHSPFSALAHLYPELCRSHDLLGDPRLWSPEQRLALRRVCWVLHHTKTESAAVRYQALLVLDALTLEDAQPARSTRATLDELVLHQASLPEVVHDLLSSCLWHSLRQTAPLGVQLLSKALPQRCQRRRYPDTVRRLFVPLRAPTQGRQRKPSERQSEKERERRGALAKFTDVLVCGLLGNYAHVPPAHRLIDARGLTRTSELRSWVYCLRTNPSYIQRLLEKWPFLLCLATREFLCFVIAQHPPFTQHCDALFDVKAFSAMAYAHMNKVRGWIAAKGCLPSTGEAAATVHGSFGVLLAQCQTEVLRLCYQRVRESCMRDLRSTRLKTELPEPTPKEQRQVIERVELMDSRLSDSAACDELFSILQVCGAPARAVAELRRLRQGYDSRVVGKRLFRREVAQISHRYPTVVRLFQLAAAWWERVRSTQLIRLPDRHWRAQAQALSQCSGLPEGVVPWQTACLLYCTVCETHYSNIRRAVTCVLRCFRYGTRDARVDLLAPELVAYCTKNKTAHERACAEQPLAVIPLLGMMLQLDRELIFLCTQEGCGAIAKYTPGLTAYTERGYMCNQCTRTHRSRGLCDMAWNALHATQSELRCAMCCGGMSYNKQAVYQQMAAVGYGWGGVHPSQTALWAAQQKFSFPGLRHLFVLAPGMLVCPKHYHPHLWSYVQNHYTPFTTHAEMVRLVQRWQLMRSEHARLGRKHLRVRRAAARV